MDKQPYISIQNGDGRLIIGITEIELNTNLDLSKKKPIRSMTFKGTFDSVEIITKKWWEFWK